MFGGAGGAGMQEQMASMMNSPMMQTMMNNPELLRSIFQSNPQIQQVRAETPPPQTHTHRWPGSLPEARGTRTLADRRTALPQLMNTNPEVASMLNNPELLRESLRMASNPVRIPAPPPPGACGLRCMERLVHYKLAVI